MRRFSEEGGIRHVENCEECFGFGHTMTGALISLSQAATFREGQRIDFKPCTLCKGTPWGADKVPEHRDNPLVKGDPVEVRQGDQP